jgi:hypothetical protein
MYDKELTTKSSQKAFRSGVIDRKLSADALPEEEFSKRGLTAD